MKKAYQVGLYLVLVLLASILVVGCSMLNQQPEEEALSRAQFQAMLQGAPVSREMGLAASMGAPTVYDYDGQIQDMAWLWEEFGDVTFQRAEPHPEAGFVFRLIALRAKCGPASLIVKVVDENGLPLKKYAVIRSWPEAPELPDFSGTTAKQWTKTGIVGKTNVEGDVGFGMGTGDYYFPPEGGASSVYVADFDGPGDYLTGLGMIGATNHCHIDSTFQRIQADNPEPPVPPTPGPGPGPTPVPGAGWSIKITGDIDISPKK